MITMPNIVEALQNKFKSGIKSWVSKSIHASGIGGACIRQLVYEQVAPTRTPHTVETEMIFSLGRLMEDQANVDLAEAFKGNEEVQVLRERLPLPPNPQNIGGQLDFSVAVKVEGKWRKYPMEFKTCSPFVYDRIHSMQDMLEDDSQWIRKYPAQLQIYMLMTDSDQGCFLLRNKVNGQYKQINVQLDYEYAESLLEKAEAINASIAGYRKACDNEGREKALPDRINYSGEGCGNCPFKSICVPDMLQAPGIENMLWDVELAALCKIREQNEQAATEYDEADKKISAHCKAVAEPLAKGESKVILVDGYTIGVKVSETTRYDVPDDIKKPFAKKGKMVRKNIEPLKA